MRLRSFHDDNHHMNHNYAKWKDAIASHDTFLFAKVGGDTDLLMRAWRRLKEYGADPMSADMLILRDIVEGINVVVEKSRKLDQLEIIPNDINASDRDVIVRISDAFYD
jgi:hypothetical protein